MLSRVDERIGFMTPQQPIKRKGAKTDKAKALSDDYKSRNIIILYAIGALHKGFFS
jgi:hypothetical protein